MRSRCAPPSLIWPQGPTHPLRKVHYTLIFQTFIAAVIDGLAFYMLANMGWWTGLEFTMIMTLVFSGTIFIVLPVQLAMGYIRPVDTIRVKRWKNAVSMLLEIVVLSSQGAAGVAMSKESGKDFRHSLDEKPPVGEWWAVVALIIIQALISVWCLYVIQNAYLGPIGIGEDLSICELEEYPINGGVMAQDGVPPRHRQDGTSPRHRQDGTSPRHRVTPVQNENSENQSAPIQASKASVQGKPSSRWRFNPFRDPRNRVDNVSENNAAEASSSRTRVSVRSRGKQRETHIDDDDDMEELSLAQVDALGKAWSPV